jgi:hypothetical protein
MSMQQKLICLLALTFASSLCLTQGTSHAGEPTKPAELESEPAQKIAWDCVPNYWWGYWTWAWEPCAWLDPEYVEHTIGAVASAESAPEVSAMPAHD